MKQEFMLGVNYWDSQSGTEMWKRWNPEEVEKDLAALKKCGVEYLRVFPNWRDFQPVKLLRGNKCEGREYVLGEDEEDLTENVNGLDYVMVERFKTFAKMADKYGMKLVVSIMTGWMSARMFYPPALEGKNLVTDPECLMWTMRFIKGIVTEFKDIKNIAQWDLGNECNNLGYVTKRSEAYTWTGIVRNTILSVDNTREISSGMHGLGIGEGNWTLEDQGEFCDYVTTHPYPSPSIGADSEPYDGLRPSIMPTAQSQYYSSIAKKPCIIQESGVFSETIGNAKMGGDWVRVNILSALANGYKGYLFWCAMEHTKLKHAPYCWVNMERGLGIVDVDRNPKPAGVQMKKMADEVLHKLPTDLQRKTDAVCVMCKEMPKHEAACGTYVLAKEAGFNITYVNEGLRVPKSDLYLMPCPTGWGVLHRRTLDSVFENVEQGATLYASFNGGHFNEFERMFGLRSNGLTKAKKKHVAKFPFGDVEYACDYEIYVESIGAEVLCRNEEGNVVLSKFAYGKGTVYFLNMPLEIMVYNTHSAMNPKKAQAKYYEIYRMFAGKQIASYKMQTQNPNIGITECLGDDGNEYVFAINYNNETEVVDFLDGYKGGYEVVYGNTKELAPCDGLIIKLKK